MTDVLRIDVAEDGVGSKITKISEGCTSEEAKEWCRAANKELKNAGVIRSYFFYQ